MKIIIDAMGGDLAPTAPVMGAVEAAKKHDVEILLVGQGEVILKVLEENGLAQLPTGIQIVHASEIIEMEDNPTTAFREKKDSSMTVGLNLLKEGAGDAFISAGSTGALLGGSTLLVKRIPGIRRAALAPVYPSIGGRTLLVDAGANAVCTPEYLLQFAFMGACYAEKVLEKPNPRVGLLNIGAEPSKGTQLQLDTFALLEQAKSQGKMNFVGNVESREGMLGEVDVIVADGWTGNIFLKTMEGTGIYVNKELKSMFLSSFKTKIGAMLVKDGMMKLKKSLDSGEVGGTALLGVTKPVIKAHGSSQDYAFVNAVYQAKVYANSGIIQTITERAPELTVAEK